MERSNLPSGSFPALSDEDLENRFYHHAPRDQRVANTHGDYRAACLIMAKVIRDLVPHGREQSLAITNLEEVMFWGNAGIARKS